MKVLVIGSGGREHSICWKLKQSPLVEALYCAPGNPGIAEIAEIVRILVDKVSELASFASSTGIDLTVVGPELPLSLGIVDVFEEMGLRIFGPHKIPAQLESSKSYAKDIMEKAGVPTASFKTFDSKDALITFLKTARVPLVLKADGLAAGKGVFVCTTKAELEAAIPNLISMEASNRVVVEDFLEGVEVSYIVATDGEQIIPMASSHDYKRLQDHDAGPMTGGVGSVCPTPRLKVGDEAQIIERVIRPVLLEMQKRGTPFKGFLYAGLMISPSGEINVLEFNVRMGDPECQSILRRLDVDFAEMLWKLASGEKVRSEISWSKECSVCVVLTSEGYPEKPVKGDEIYGLEEALSLPGVAVFHAGTSSSSQGKLITSGGRVLNITATGETLSVARERVYQAANCIKFRGKQQRSDIGLS